MARLLKLPEVKAQVGLSKASIYDLIRTGHFPRPKRLTANRVAWSSDDIDAWVDSRPSTTPTESEDGTARVRTEAARGRSGSPSNPPNPADPATGSRAHGARGR